MSANYYFCQLCINSHAYSSFSSLYTHINHVHGNDPSFKIRCELTSLCGSIYRTFPSYKSHIYKHHRELISKPLDKEVIFSPSNNDSNNSFTFSCTNDHASENETTDNDNNENFQLMNEYDEEIEVDYPLFTETVLENDKEPFNMKKFQKYYTSFLLELREQHLLSQNIITSITSSFSLLFNIILKIIKGSASDTNAATAAVIPIIKIEETISVAIRTIEDAAKNEYQFIKNCKEFFQYEEPQKVELNESGGCGYVISIKKSIQNFLHKSDVIDLLIKNTNETISTIKKDKDLLLTYRDGTATATNKSLEKNINSFLLQLYSDEVSVTNPIGPKKDEKKLLLFYYILDDLPPIIRSLLNSIGLIGIYLSKLLTNPSHRRIYFEAMINDLNELQTKGLTVSTCSGRLYFAFDFIAADNLTANDLGGFQKNFNNGYFCRMCYISYDYRSIPLTDISFILRSEASHESYLNQVLQSENSIFGITGRSDFSSLLAFHAVKSLPFDIMHDFSEGKLHLSTDAHSSFFSLGVCMIIVKSILKELSARRILTYAQIEARLEAFKYGQNDQSNRPPTARPKHLTNNHIAGSASQKLLLFQMLPIIFIDVINDLTDLLPIYTCLREIVSIVFATKIRKSWLPYLTSLTISFHSLILAYLPDNITPKVHFITHYPELIKRNGPARNYWCQRFKGKHLYFKKLASRSWNFKNISYTLAKRHQLRLSLLLSYGKFYNLIDKSISTKTIKSSQLPLQIKLLLLQHQFDSLTFIECQTLIHKSVKYIKNSVFITALHHEEEIPEFVLLCHILKLNDSWKLIVQHLETLSFDQTLWSYEINYLEKFSIMNLDECLNILSHGLDVYFVKKSSFVNVLTRLTA